MGFFSWHASDTNQVIWNRHSAHGRTSTVFLIDNRGNSWREDAYDGYGEFGGKDFYELLAEMNGQHSRSDGISLAFSGKPYLSPQIAASQRHQWRNIAPKEHRGQGFRDTSQ